MLQRRSLLLSLLAAGAWPGLPRRALAADAPPTESAKLAALLDRFAEQALQLHPELATGLGLDTGVHAGLKAKLTDQSAAAIAADHRRTADNLGALRAIDRGKLAALDLANYDTVAFILQSGVDGNAAIPYAGGSLASPYQLNQLSGAYHDMPDFLDIQHAVATGDDAEAYLARLEAIAVVMGEELDQVRHDAAMGVVPPDFVLDKTLAQMKSFLDTPADRATLVMSLVRRAASAGLKADYQGPAAAIYAGKILPALQKQADFLTALRKTAVHDAGIARLPKGAEYYALSLKSYTTSSMTQAEIHQTGLDLVAKLSGSIDATLKAQGYTKGSVGERLAALQADPTMLYANTDAAKEQLIADLNAKVREVQAKLPAWFGKLPKAHVEIRRVPKAIEAGAPGGYYQSGSLDGSRPGVYWINLRDSAEMPRWTLPTLTYHESIPGHHLQGTLTLEMPGLPLIRKMVWFSGYGEGWALYAEQLAVEMGMYEHDPLGAIGQMRDALFRAIRLVVDTGLHAQGWSREKAIGYYVNALGEKPSAATTEVERYCVWPGQACSYMVGKLTWLRVREKARTALGAKFDIRAFHDAALLSGALPLDVLERVVDSYIKANT